MGVKKITVLHKRQDCIGCGSCVLLDLKHRKMDSSDGKARLLGAEDKGTPYLVGSVDADDIRDTYAAERSCPVQIIKVS